MQDQFETLQIKPEVATIQEVIQQLDLIISWAEQTGSPRGYFACLYRQVTIRVKAGIEQQGFEKGKRMEKLDVVFANRYFQALHDYASSGHCTNSWKRAFEVEDQHQLLVLQHLLLGMNAHINLDLGLAAVSIARGERIFELEEDFMAINDLLNQMIRDVQQQLNKVSPAFFVFDFMGGKKDEYLAAFSLEKARDYAWAIAKRLAFLSEKEKEIAIPKIDAQAEKLAMLIISPPKWWIRFAIKAVLLLERKSPVKIIGFLR